MEDEDGLYSPSSSFLVDVLNGTAPLSGHEFAEANLRLLIQMTRDGDRANRDWSVFILSQMPIDNPEVRGVLLHAAGDSNSFVSAEAIVGLARRDRKTALQLVAKALSSKTVALKIFEAAAYCADASLIEALQHFAQPNDRSYENEVVTDALAACKTRIPPAP